MNSLYQMTKGVAKEVAKEEVELDEILEMSDDKFDQLLEDYSDEELITFEAVLTKTLALGKLAYSRDITHYDQILMEELIEACHKLFERKLPVWDQMYMLKVLSYGELQKIYKDKISEADRFISRAHM